MYDGADDSYANAFIYLWHHKWTAGIPLTSINVRIASAYQLKGINGKFYNSNSIVKVLLRNLFAEFNKLENRFITLLTRCPTYNRYLNITQYSWCGTLMLHRTPASDEGMHANKVLCKKITTFWQTNNVNQICNRNQCFL